MAATSKDARERAEARFQKAQSAASEGQRAKAEYDARTNALRKRTEVLRELRLKQEAADKERVESVSQSDLTQTAPKRRRLAKQAPSAQ
jgi:hypothetical protein